MAHAEAFRSQLHKGSPLANSSVNNSGSHRFYALRLHYAAASMYCQRSKPELDSSLYGYL